jgi:hypothetical protein
VTRLILLFLALVLFSPAPAQAAARTLAVQAGGKKLMLAAPAGMCFIDPTGSALQRSLYATLGAPVAQDRGQQLLAVFIDCANISDPSTWIDGAPAYGFISWLNPSVGATVNMSRQDYLDMREASLAEYAAARAGTFTPAVVPHRTAHNASIGLMGMEGVPGLEHKAVVIIATTLLRQVPIEMTVHSSASMGEAYAAMDKAMEKEIQFNE